MAVEEHHRAASAQIYPLVIRAPGYDRVARWVAPPELALVVLLTDLGAHVVQLAEAVDYLSDGQPLPPRPAVVTFDDGYEDVYGTAASILSDRHMTATVFVVAAP